MHLLNRVSLIGRFQGEPSIAFQGYTPNLMTFTVSTQSRCLPNASQSRACVDHQVAIEDPMMIEYANSYLRSGDLVSVEGRLEYLSYDLKEPKQTWVVVREGDGFIHPLKGL